jgi:hypothetical protein
VSFYFGGGGGGGVFEPIMVTSRSKAWTVFARWKIGILGWNPTQDMVICMWVYSVFMFFLRRADHSSKEPYRLCKKDYGTEEEAKTQQRAIESLMKEWMNEWWYIWTGISFSWWAELLAGLRRFFAQASVFSNTYFYLKLELYIAPSPSIHFHFIFHFRE